MPVDLFTIPALLNYDTAVDWPARLTREGPFLLRVLEPAPSRRLLDLGSGTGEHAHWLAAQGFSVVGIEGVKERWEVARHRAVPGTENLVGDLGAVEAMVRGQFGGALCLGNTLPALVGVEAVSRMLVGLRRRLLPGGIFVAQQLNYDRIFAQDLRALPERRMADDGGELVFERDLAPREDGVVGVTERVVLRAPAGTDRVLHQRHLFQQGWRHAELLTLLDVAGFRSVEVVGGFGGEAFDLESSAELVIVAR
jgi:SAM-dependent methyltransferase